MATVIGPGVYVGTHLNDMGFYVLAHLIGGVIAATVYKLFLRKGDLEDEEEGVDPQKVAEEMDKKKVD